MVEEQGNKGVRSHNPGSSNSGRRNRRRGKGKGNPERRKVNVDNEFAGKYADMNGHVFQCNHETDKRDQFEKTVEELTRYAATYFSNSRDIKALLTI